MSDTYQSLSHSRWNCKYHVVFVPKRRRKTMYGRLRKALGTIFHELARQKECRIIEGHLMPDHVHICLEIPPKHSVASVIGFLQGQSAVAIARQLSGRERHFTGEHFWARGYAVSTVGFALEQVRADMRDQESADDKGRFEGKGQRPSVLATTQVARSTAFEAVLLIKPPALPGVSDFRDAKQYWGLEDFMNVTSTGVTNAANLSLFMVNVASCLRADGHAREPDYSVLDLKADYRGYKYVEETIKMLPEKPEPVLLAKLLNQVASLGRIHATQSSFSFS